MFPLADMLILHVWLLCASPPNFMGSPNCHLGCRKRVNARQMYTVLYHGLLGEAWDPEISSPFLLRLTCPEQRDARRGEQTHWWHQWQPQGREWQPHSAAECCFFWWQVLGHPSESSETASLARGGVQGPSDTKGNDQNFTQNTWTSVFKKLNFK